jgi:maspardin
MSSAAKPKTDATTIEADARSKLSRFQQIHPLRSADVGGRAWVYRWTPGRSSEQLPVVMVPGIQGGGDVFFEVALVLGDLIPVITLNAPDIEDVTEISSDLVAFLRAIGVARANFVGTSLGGYLAQSVALRSPGIVDQLVIANGFIDVSTFVEKLPPAAAVRETDAVQLVEQNLQPLLAMPAFDEGQVRLKTVLKALVGVVQTLENFKSRLLLAMGAPRLAVPSIPAERVMIIDDDHDPILPPEMRDAVRKRFRRSEQHAIDGGGHLPAIQRPAQFVDLLRRRLVRDD